MATDSAIAQRNDERQEKAAGQVRGTRLPVPGRVAAWRRYVNSVIAAEIAALSRYCDGLVQYHPRGNDLGVLFDAIPAPGKQVCSDAAETTRALGQAGDRPVILLNGNINHDLDIEGTFASLKPLLGRGGRLVLVAYNPYLRWLYRLANILKLRHGEEPTTFVTETDLNNLARLSGYEVVRIRYTAYCPFHFFGLGNLINRLLPVVPLLGRFGLATVVVLRPLVRENKLPSLSIVIPARNERGNIENALQRLRCLKHLDLEVLFVEGHSNDGTWEEIERIVEQYRGEFQLKALRQTGKGKSDAVRLGFAHASKELLTILDADLTMPPELLHRFYDAYAAGLADFVNGSRLVYPMEGQAMRFVNRLGNVFFAKALSSTLGVRIGDSLCGTKLMSRRDYGRMTQWRRDFGDFDPFGDFELLFPAAILGLGVIDVPIRYRDRVYGSTNISRFRHGWMLLKMTATGFLRVRLGRVR